MPPPSSALPSSFTSLYRLFLRTASASVLHHPPAVRHIRRLWRPFFEDGAQAAHLLARSDGASPEFMRVRQWYNTFEQRMDNTLTLLVNAAGTRGLPHTLTKQLAVLRRAHLLWFRQHNYSVLGTWNPSLPRKSPQYTPEGRRRMSAGKTERRTQTRAFDERAWEAMSEVVRMAEGSARVSLGTVVVVARKAGDPAMMSAERKPRGSHG